jgi:uncharacterized protein (DUF924 family)
MHPRSCQSRRMSPHQTPLSDLASDPLARELLDWWIGIPPYEIAWLSARQRLWFGSDALVDARIRSRYAPALRAAAAGELQHWQERPGDWLALLILLDQFPRNLHRGDAQAFAHDARALALAEAGIARGLDRALPPGVRLFCYLPFEHAEDLALQQRSVALFEALARDAPVGFEAIFAGWLDYARRHLQPIARFGRFPHRNAALERESSPEERDWLAGHPQGF